MFYQSLHSKNTFFFCFFGNETSLKFKVGPRVACSGLTLKQSTALICPGTAELL